MADAAARDAGRWPQLNDTQLLATSLPGRG